MTKTYNHILSSLNGQPLAIRPEKMAEIRSFLAAKQAGAHVPAIEAKARPAASVKGTVAVMPLFGCLAQRMDIMDEISGGTSTENFSKQFQALVNDPSIKAIVINVDSPGGSVYGTQELAEVIYKAREQKHIVAIANSEAASAAYWIASAADEFVVTPGGQVGSIGVITIHEDWSEAMADAGVKATLIKAGEFKYEGNYYEPLTEDAKAAIQSRIDTYYDAFVSTVARNRGTTAKIVKANFGQGRMMLADAAKAAGMVDRIDTLDGVLSRLGVSTASQQQRMSASMATKQLELASV
jgi:signal peptide peptidase SppA